MNHHFGIFYCFWVSLFHSPFSSRLKDCSGGGGRLLLVMHWSKVCIHVPGKGWKQSCPQTPTQKPPGLLDPEISIQRHSLLRSLFFSSLFGEGEYLFSSNEWSLIWTWSSCLISIWERLPRGSCSQERVSAIHVEWVVTGLPNSRGGNGVPHLIEDVCGGSVFCNSLKMLLDFEGAVADPAVNTL